MKISSLESLDNALTTNLIPQLENLSLPFIEAIEAFHTDDLINFIKNKSKEKNREDYVETIQIITDYLSERGLEHRTAADLIDKFKAGTLANAEDELMNTIQNVYNTTKKEFEFELPQLRQALIELKESKVN